MGGNNPAQSKVKVIVRVRPLLSHEPNTPCIYVHESDQVRLVVPGRGESYGFKYVLYLPNNMKKQIHPPSQNLHLLKLCYIKQHVSINQQELIV